MMNEEDRKKVFWLLKKYSSYTAWKALGDAYAEFVKAWEYAMSHTPGGGGPYAIDWYKDILDGQIAFEKGLPLLREGQRSVFRNTSTGYLARAADAIVFVSRIMDPEEFVHDWMPNKDEVIRATKELDARTSGLLSTCEGDDTPVVAYGMALMFRPLNAPFNYPSHLPDVPAPTDTTANTGEELAITGIWEPEWEIAPSVDDPSPSRVGLWNSVGQYASGLLKPLDTSPAKIEKGGMSYLLAGTGAAKYKEGELDPEINVTWRLIWADQRYLDGTIPEEENDYLAEAVQEAPRPNHGRLRGLRNEIVPKTGWWHSIARPNGQALHYFEAGQHFPDWQFTTTGEVIWDYDPNQQQQQQQQQPPPKP